MRKYTRSGGGRRVRSPRGPDAAGRRRRAPGGWARARWFYLNRMPGRTAGVAGATSPRRPPAPIVLADGAADFRERRPRVTDSRRRPPRLLLAAPGWRHRRPPPADDRSRGRRHPAAADAGPAGRACAPPGRPATPKRRERSPRPHAPRARGRRSSSSSWPAPRRPSRRRSDNARRHRVAHPARELQGPRLLPPRLGDLPVAGPPRRRRCGPCPNISAAAGATPKVLAVSEALPQPALRGPSAPLLSRPPRGWSPPRLARQHDHAHQRPGDRGRPHVVRGHPAPLPEERRRLRASAQPRAVRGPAAGGAPPIRRSRRRASVCSPGDAAGAARPPAPRARP